MNRIVIGILLLCSGTVFADAVSFKLYEVPLSTKENSQIDSLLQSTAVDPGQVIGWGKDLVTLGQSIYDLVQKGKPTITTSNDKAICILPRIPNTTTYVEVMDLEEASDPIKRKFIMSVKNGFNSEVIRMEFMLIYQVAKYDGKGKYIINAILLPKVSVGYGFDFSSDMRVIGASNKGTKADPVTSLILDLHYKFGSFLKGVERNDAITLTGKGEVTIN